MLRPPDRFAAPFDAGVLDVFPVPAWFVPPGSDAMHFNRAWVEATGLTSRIGLDEWPALLAPEHQDAAAETVRRIREGADVDGGIVRIRDARGAWRRFSVQVTGHHEPEGRAYVAALIDVEAHLFAEDRQQLLDAANRAFTEHDDADSLIDALLAIIVPAYADYAVVDLFDDDGTFERYAFAGPEHIRREIDASRARYAAADVAPAGTSWDVATHEGILFVAEGETYEQWSDETREFNRRLGVRSAIVAPLVDRGRRLGAFSVARTDPQRPPFQESAVAFYAAIAARTATALQRARGVRALQQSEELYRRIADEIPLIVGLTNPDGSIYYLNRRSTEYTGVPFVERGGDKYSEFIHPEDRARLADEWGSVLESGEPLETRYRMRRHDGVYRWFLNRAAPVRDAHDRIVTWVGTATDIDEMQRREQALRVAVEAGEIFARTLDTTSALNELAAAAVRHLAEWCGVYVFDEGGTLQPIAIAHAQPEMMRLAREYLRRYPVDETSGIAVVARTGVTERIGPIPREAYATIADVEQREFLQRFPLYAMMNVPLAVGEERFGALSLALSSPERIFDDDDERLALLLAQRAAIAVNNARLYERQRAVAVELQGAFLPATLPEVAGVAFDAVYVPGTADLVIGGDWYDAEVRPDGLIAFSIGDIAGHGLSAAVPMSKMRQTFRALGTVERDPSRVVTAADAILRREHDDVFATSFFGLLHPASGELHYVNAGHPPPFVRRADGTTHELEAAGAPLGLAGLEPPETRTARLAEGEMLLAFTDGLLEQDRDIEAGQRAVANALAHPAFGLCSTPAALLRALVVTTPRDDIAILAVRRNAAHAAWSFSATDARAAQATRAALKRRLGDLGFAEETIAAVELIAGEVIGNAARYAPGVVDLSLENDAGQLVLRAVDRGKGFVWSAARPADDSERGRGLYLIEMLSESVRLEILPNFGTYLEMNIPRAGKIRNV